MYQKKVGSNVIESLLKGALQDADLTEHQVNKLVVTANCSLTPQQRQEIKGFFVFNEAPSLSSRSAFEAAIKDIFLNQPVCEDAIA